MHSDQSTASVVFNTWPYGNGWCYGLCLDNPPPKPNAVIGESFSELTESEYAIDSWYNASTKGARIKGGWLLNQPTDWYGTTLTLVVKIQYEWQKEDYFVLCLLSLLSACHLQVLCCDTHFPSHTGLEPADYGLKALQTVS